MHSPILGPGDVVCFQRMGRTVSRFVGTGTSARLLREQSALDPRDWPDDFQRYLRSMALDQDTEQQVPGGGTIDHSPSYRRRRRRAPRGARRSPTSTASLDLEL